MTEFLKLGGTTTFLCNLGGELVRRGIPVRVDSFESDHPLALDFARLGVSVAAQSHNTYIFEDRLRNILNNLAAFKPTSVIASLGVNACEVLRYLPPGIQRVAMVQTDSPDVYPRMRPYWAWLDLLVGVSRSICEKLALVPEFQGVRIAHLPYGVPMPKEFARTIRPSETPLRVLYLGRLDQEQKRVRLLPEIQKILVEAQVPLEWTIVGDGPERTHLEATMISGREGQRVDIRGGLPYQAVAPLLAHQDIFLLVSDYEGLPLSLLECMGQGIVPVVSDLPSGIREVVDLTTGIRVPTDAIKGYAEAIRLLHEDRRRLRDFADAAQQRVRLNYSVAAMTNRWLDVIATPATLPAWKLPDAVKPVLGLEDRWCYQAEFRPIRRVWKRLKTL